MIMKYIIQIVLSGFTDLQKKYNALNTEPTNFSELPRVFDNIWVEKGKAEDMPAKVYESSEAISNHKLVYSTLTIAACKRE